MCFLPAERAAVTSVMDDGDRGAQSLRMWLDIVDFDNAGQGLWPHSRSLAHRRAASQTARANGRDFARDITMRQRARIRNSLRAQLCVSDP